MKLKRKYSVVTSDLKEYRFYFCKDVIDFLKEVTQKEKNNVDVDVYIDRECIFMIHENEITLYNDAVKIPKRLYNFFMKNFLKSGNCLIKTLDFLK